jgi:hypothetical protein
MSLHHEAGFKAKPKQKYCTNQKIIAIGGTTFSVFLLASPG